MRYLNLIRLSFKLSILNELQYRANFVIQIFQTVFELVVALGGLAIVYSHTENLNGWTEAELIVVVGVYFVIGGFIEMFIQPSMVRLMEDVHRGTLDFMLLKPVEAQMMVSTREVQLWKGVNIVAGTALIGGGVANSSINVSAGEALGFLGLLALGLIIVYSFWLILTTCAFWFTKVDNILAVFDSIYEAGRYPTRVYPGWLQFVLTLLVPIAFAVTVPAEALLGRLTSETVIVTLFVALLMLMISRLFWRVGLRRYSGASS